MESMRLRIAWNRPWAYGITRKRVYNSPCGLIPYSLTRDSIPQQVADSIRSLCERFHTRLRRDLSKVKLLAFLFCGASRLVWGQAHAMVPNS